jgi:hypothetical protein
MLGELLALPVLGNLGLLIGLSATRGGFPADPRKVFGALAIIAAIGLDCSYFGYYFGRRAPHVTRRFLGMAQYAVVSADLPAYRLQRSLGKHL